MQAGIGVRRLGYGLAMVGLVLSAGLAGRLGFVSGGSLLEAVVFATSCVLLEVWKAVLPVVIAAVWFEHPKTCVLLGVLMAGLMLLSLVGALAFAEANRGGVAGRSSEAARQAASMREDNADAVHKMFYFALARRPGGGAHPGWSDRDASGRRAGRRAVAQAAAPAGGDRHVSAWPAYCVRQFADGSICTGGSGGEARQN
jgi:hypothetical protein